LDEGDIPNWCALDELLDIEDGEDD
jgi:hypothetical protein